MQVFIMYLSIKIIKNINRKGVKNPLLFRTKTYQICDYNKRLILYVPTFFKRVKRVIIGLQC